MKKIKLLTSLSITAASLTLLAPVLTGCSCGNSQPVTPKVKVNDIVVGQQPDKIHYDQYDKLDLDGLLIQKVMSNGKLEKLYKNEYTTSIPDGAILSNVGDITITVTSIKDKKTTSFKINVVERTSAEFNLIETEKGYCIDGLNNPTRGSITEIVVPESINGIPVVEISKGAFKGCKNLQSITLPFIGHSATSIGTAGLFGYVFGDEMYDGCGAYTWQSYSTNDQYGVEPKESVAFAIPSSLKNVTITGGSFVSAGAFSGCSHLQNITFKETNSFEATEIGNFAFYNCISLKETTIPSKIATIGRCAYQGCFNMKNIEIPETVQKIKHNAFANCLSAYKVIIPNTVTEMGKLVFENFAGLLLCETETIPSGWDSEWVSSDSTVVYNYNNGGVIYSDKMIAAICGQEGEEQYISVISWLGDWTKTETLTVPGEVSYNGMVYKVRSLGANLFLGNDVIKTVTLSENITSIGPNCFDGCTNLETINFPSTLKTIGSSCFVGCEKLCKSTNKPGYVETDEPEIYFNNVEEIGISAFEGLVSVAKVDFGSKMKTIRDYAFKNCINLAPLRELDGKTKNPLLFPKSIETIGTEAFYNISKLIPEDEEKIKLKSAEGDIIFESGNTNDVTIGESAFELAGVRTTTAGLYPNTISFHVNFNNIKLNKFNNAVFKNCYTRSLFNFPQTITEIGNYAFYDSIPVYTIENDTTSSTCRLLTIPKSVKKIGNYAFHDCYNCGFKFEGAKTGESQLTHIGDYAFRYCSYNPNEADDKSGGAYKEIVIPETVEYLGAYAFGSNNGARTANIPTNEKLTRLESGVFNSCINLGANQTLNNEQTAYVDPIVVPSNITYIGANVFSSCALLKAVTIQGKITSIGSSCFSGCTSLANSETLKSLVFVDEFKHVSSIGSNLYQGCTKLVWAPFPQSSVGVETPYAQIPSTCFAECESMTSFEVLDAITTIGNAAFRDCKSMTKVTGMNAVKYIYQNAFADCSALVQFDMPKGCHTIGDYAFSGCTNLGKSDANKFILPTDIVQAWSSSSNKGMGIKPFNGWTADQKIYFRDVNIESTEASTGKKLTKWGWTLIPDNVTSPTYYTCSTSGSSKVKFVLLTE